MPALSAGNSRLARSRENSSVFFSGESIKDKSKSPLTNKIWQGRENIRPALPFSTRISIGMGGRVGAETVLSSRKSKRAEALFCLIYEPKLRAQGQNSILRRFGSSGGSLVLIRVRAGRRNYLGFGQATAGKNACRLAWPILSARPARSFCWHFSPLPVWRL